jgi:glycosyltransferase involved in cell wall biosynthesis
MSARRVLILPNRVPYPLKDGGNMATDAIIQGYQQQGWEVYLLSMNTTRHKVDAITLRNLYRNLYKFETVDINNSVNGVQVIRNLLFSKLPNHAERFYHLSFNEKLSTVLADFKPDVVHIESVFLTSYLHTINHYNPFTVLRLHNIEWQVWQRLAIETKGVKSWYLNHLAKRIKVYEQDAWNSYNLLLPITKHDAEVVKQTSVRETYTVHFGIKPKQYTTSSEQWVGYHIGAMDWLPNKEAMDWFVNDIWPVIKQTVPDFQFYFAGRNMPQSYTAFNINGIYCEGEVLDADSFIADKKILIVPLRSGGGVRVKILEAMASGKLVVSTCIGMQGIDAIEGEHYLLADTPEAFATQLKWAISNKTAAHKLAQNAQSLIAEKYNSTEIASELSQKLLSSIANK